MFHAWHLGNDIVDLADPRHAGKARDDRFLRRVFSEGERAAIRRAADADRALWMGWAGKEAAFKTVSKSLGSTPIFVHAAFEVDMGGPADRSMGGVDEPDPPVSHFGQVRFGSILLPLRIEVAGATLHAVTWTPPSPGEVPSFSWGFETIPHTPDPWRETLRPAFSPREWSCISHRASALARLAARRAMAEALNLSEGDLEIGCGPGRPGQRIPMVFRSGEETAVDLTLSHHGRLLAWAFLTDGNPASDPGRGQSQGR